MSEKAFTLFTALVSFILIGITVLILQHMSNSESNFSNIFFSASKSSEIETFKDLIRLDALNTVNFFMSQRIADYFDSTNPNDTSFKLQDMSWKDQVDTFEKDYFVGSTSGSTTVGNFLSQAAASQLGNYRGFYKSLYFFRIFDPTQLNNSTNLFDTASNNNITISGLGSAINKAIPDSNILELINCNKFIYDENYSPNCKIGSFYVTLDLSKLQQIEYANMLRLALFETPKNSFALDDAILPRNKFRLYVPIRLFKAMSDFLNIKDYFAEKIWIYLKDIDIGYCPTNNLCPLQNGAPNIGDIQDCLQGNGNCKVQKTVSFHMNNNNVNLDNFKFDVFNPSSNFSFKDKISEKVCNDLNTYAVNKTPFDIVKCDISLDFGVKDRYNIVVPPSNQNNSFVCESPIGATLTLHLRDNNTYFVFKDSITYNFAFDFEHSINESAINCNYIYNGELLQFEAT